MTRPAAVVFDMDGLLLDSERLARASFLQACRSFQWEPDMNVYNRCVGTTVETTEYILKEGFGGEFPFDQVSELWERLYHDHALHRPIDVKTGARELLTRLGSLAIPRALVTSTQRSTAIAKLNHAGLEGHFSHLVCGGETTRGKPHPEPYLEVIRRMEVSPENCWALEDSDNGVRAAHAAGLEVFQIPDLLEPGAEVRELGHHIVDDLADVLSLLEKGCSIKN
ncbi:MAG: HAD family phosphatase [Gammaproteobacteria bacterium]|nr:HAD family phosphatase [Gammaproteobacteria bacterium]